MSPRVRRLLVLTVTLLALGTDAVLCGVATGIAAVTGMLGALGWVLWQRRQHRNAGVSRSRRLRGRLWWTLFAGGLGFACARAIIVYSDLQSPVAGGGHDPAVRTYLVVYAVFFGLLTALEFLPRQISRILVLATTRPALLLTWSFGALIVIGTLLLTLPVSVHRMEDVSLIDALFTITSAVCVTGLAVNDPGVTYTPFGQGVLLACIQLGGIGIMSVAGLVAVSRSSTSLESHSQYAAMMDAGNLHDLKLALRSVVLGTLFIELVGTLLLWLLFQGDPRLEGRSALWLALFHSVSAFSNAGFSLFRGNLTSFAEDSLVQLVLAALIVLGGLGFPVILELTRSGWRGVLGRIGFRRPSRRHSLHARVVLATTGILIAGGSLLILLLESGKGLHSLGGVDTVMNALFMSVATRSAGFNTVDLAQFREATLLLICLLMFIGGSPASTAGGVKTTTAATLFVTMKGELLGRPSELFGRAIPSTVVSRGVAVVTISSAIILGTTFLLVLVEQKPFLPLVVEATSAYCTAGLSVGVTPELSWAGRLILTVAMFLGRVGPFTIAVAAGGATSRPAYRLAEESMPIG